VTRILHIIPTLDRGGAEKQLALLSAGLKQRAWDVHVACLTRGGPWEAELNRAAVPYHILGKRWKFDPVAYFALKQHIAKLKPDIVQTWLFAANSYGRQAALACGVKHVIASERCVDPWKSWWQLAIDRHLAARTTKIVANSAGVVEFYTQRGLPADKFALIPNGMELPTTNTAAISRSELLEQLQLPPQARLIAAVGRLWPQKRLKDLIWAFDLLQCVLDDVYLLIIGDGPQRWRLERYASQVQPEGKVRFLGERGDVPKLLPHMECLWLGSEYEGQSNAILEAMATGLPVVATNIAGNRELVVPGETGYLVPVGDRAGIATATRELLSNSEQAERWGQAGRARVASEFSLEGMVSRYEQLYRDLLASK
jgi:glycosyltransferase involved in cell wall biosynthesis